MMDIRDKVKAMGLGQYKLIAVAATTYRGNSSAKQANSALKPVPERRRAEDWPTLVIECGIPESLQQLRRDAHWWLVNSRGNVKIVVVIHSKIRAESFAIEKWQLNDPAPGPMTRLRTGPNFKVPTCTKMISINKPETSNVFVASDELIIEFEDFMLRQPVPPVEQNIVFTKQNLVDWAEAMVTGTAP